jgi:hypothetical protein
MAVARYRERHRVARAKSDHADAVALANILRTDADWVLTAKAAGSVSGGLSVRIVTSRL